MYLFVWPDRRIRQVNDNLTIMDYLAVRQGLLTIIRFDCNKQVYARLVFDNNRAVWVPIIEGDDAISPDGKIHY